MKPILAAILLTTPFLFSCAYNNPYTPAKSTENAAYSKANRYVYPNDVRTNLAQFTNGMVVWAGIITRTDAAEGKNGLIDAVTTLDHHYFDWSEDQLTGHKEYTLSPRGEGPFKIAWQLRRTEADSTPATAERYAAPGKMAIVYGVPKTVNGEVVSLDYTYLRIMDPQDVSTEKYDYGRFGEPVTRLEK